MHLVDIHDTALSGGVKINKLDISMGRRIKRRREQLGLTQEALVALTQPEMSVKHLSGVENGHKGLSAEMLRRVALALEVSSDSLLGLDDDSHHS